MKKVQSYHIIVFMIILNMEAFSQIPPSLILPNESNSNVQLNITAFPNLNAQELGHDFLSVFVKNEMEEYNLNAVQGRYTVQNDYLVFTPYFSFEKGLTYVARINAPETELGFIYTDFIVGEKASVDAPSLLHIYPTSDELPENLLRFYFYFNTPMKRDQSLQHIHLVDADGNIDNHAFMEFKQELWSADGKRLTLLFDPGRIKRGVSTNLELGPALLEGKNYKIAISGTWQDVYGQELSVETTKEFVVGPAYREQIVIEEFVIQKPEVNSDDSLRILFDRLMDHALIQSMIRIEDENNNLLPGLWEASKEEKVAQFIPDSSWQKGTYRIVIDSRLEDIAGNNLNDLLDVNLTASKQNMTDTHLILSFDLE